MKLRLPSLRRRPAPPPARPRLDQRYVERRAYHALCAGRIDEREYLTYLRGER